ncbi:hypothetical protein PHET_06282 [Paragonimus heterotremus]|uniref:DUF4455 domain-containing protein n=1 Tax=Paragonimus heterotremus TaxID=100268 RepID=A0A8J4TJ20_9TREM|nr:hypothetical protein PHET_06282 [Paragonimus heterotremus]
MFKLDFIFRICAQNIVTLFFSPLSEQCCFVWAANANNVALAKPIYRFGETLLGFWEEFGAKPVKFCQQTLTTRLLTERQNAADLVKQKDVALNFAIDSLRQSATDDQVTDRLHEVLRLLDLIKNIYSDTRTQQISIVDSYPGEVENVLNTYETACLRFFGVKLTTSGGSFAAMHTKSDKGRSNHLQDVFRVRQPTRSVDGYGQFGTGSPKNDSRSSHSDSQVTRKKQSAGVNYRYYQVKARSDAINDLRLPLRPESQVVSIKNPDCSTNESEYFENLILEITTSGIIGGELPAELIEAPLIKEAYMENAQKPETQSLVKVCLKEGDLILVDKFIVNSIHVRQISAYESLIHRIKRRACEDVANVRLTELSLHRARIQRHIDAVKLILQDLRSNITGELNNQLDASQSQMLERVEATVQHKLTQSTRSTM